MDSVMTLKEAWDIIESLNDQAHSYAYDMWCEADKMDEESGEAEDQRVLASEQQSEYFNELFDDQHPDTIAALLHCAKVDEDFKSQLQCYSGLEY